MDVSHRTSPNHPHLQHFIDQAHNLPGAVVTAVVHPVDALSLAGTLQAAAALQMQSAAQLPGGYNVFFL